MYKTVDPNPNLLACVLLCDCLIIRLIHLPHWPIRYLNLTTPSPI